MQYHLFWRIPRMNGRVGKRVARLSSKLSSATPYWSYEQEHGARRMAAGYAVATRRRTPGQRRLLRGCCIACLLHHTARCQGSAVRARRGNHEPCRSKTDVWPLSHPYRGNRTRTVEPSRGGSG